MKNHEFKMEKSIYKVSVTFDFNIYSFFTFIKIYMLYIINLAGPEKFFNHFDDLTNYFLITIRQKIIENT